MSAKATLVLLFAASCGFHASPSTGGGGDDDVVDAMVGHDTATVDGFCVQDTAIAACLAVDPGAPLVISRMTMINTDDPAMCASNTTGDASAYCVLAGSSITIATGQTLSAHGGRPLVLLSNGPITVAGTIDVAGHQMGAPQAIGPGVPACTAGTAADQHGGGAGGSFGTSGGAGGVDAGGHFGGIAGAKVTPTTLRGGCPGIAGLDTGGAAGPAGGGLAVLSSMSIEIDGVINASGGGGSGSSTANRGGGGGGAGGMIVIDAPAVTGTGGRILANGGSGGEGAGGNPGNNGNDAPLDPTMPAAGGGDNTSGGNGGNGAIASNPGIAGGTGTSGAAGGGGGGGGVGVIKLYRASALPGAVSPPPS